MTDYLNFPTRDPAATSHDSAASQRAADAELKVDRVEREVQHLALVCEGLWNLLKEKHGYSDEELMAQISAIEIKKSKPNAKKASSARQCPKCQRIATRYQSACPYCGNYLTPSLFE